MELAIVIAVYLIVIVGLAILFLTLTERLRERRVNREYERLKREQPRRVFGTDEYYARFDHPDFAAIEAHINRPLPLALKNLYADKATMRAEEFIVTPPGATEPEDALQVGYFFPADADAINDLWSHEYLDANQIPIATDGDSGLYCVDLTAANEQDPPVYFDYHDRDGFAKVADSLSEFLSWRRGSRKDGDSDANALHDASTQ